MAGEQRLISWLHSCSTSKVVLNMCTQHSWATTRPHPNWAGCHWVFLRPEGSFPVKTFYQAWTQKIHSAAPPSPQARGLRHAQLLHKNIMITGTRVSEWRRSRLEGTDLWAVSHPMDGGGPTSVTSCHVEAIPGWLGRLPGVGEGHLGLGSPLCEDRRHLRAPRGVSEHTPGRARWARQVVPYAWQGSED